MSQVQIKSLRPRHDAIIDWLLINPGAPNLNPLCALMNISRTWLSIVMQSDVFKEEYTRRRQEHNGELTKQLVEKQLKVTLKALDKVDFFLNDDDEVDLQGALEVADKTAKHLGFHPRPGFGPVIEETQERVFRSVDAGTLHEARETIRRVTHGALATD
ncbi:MAG: hypothetical protein O7D34_02165 [Ignavibacteria bacterium]|nr:hypothetical protein [Ignavibacteria bacterium]